MYLESTLHEYQQPTRSAEYNMMDLTFRHMLLDCLFWGGFLREKKGTENQMHIKSTPSFKNILLKILTVLVVLFHRQ
jgi:hypothetical protein